MINIIKTLIESIDTDIKLVDDNSSLMEEGYNELYKKTVVDINRIYKEAKDKIHENIIQIRDFVDSNPMRIDNTQVYRVHAFTMNPVVDSFNKSLLVNYVANAKKKDLSSCDPISEIGLRLVDCNDRINNILGEPVETNITDVVAKEKLACIKRGMSRISDELEEVRDILIGQLTECNSEALFKLVYDTSISILRLYMGNAYALMKAFLELYQSYSLEKNTLTEAVTEENVSKYIQELREMIPKLREFYDKFKYKEIITPRKKTINKMDEYMRGALNRKYTLKIPIYKVEDASPDAKKIIEERFIRGLDRIVDKYPNYILLTPDFKDDSDMFIYVTLKEPFGDKGDRSNRVQQSKDDGAVIAEGVSPSDVAALMGGASAIASTTWNIARDIKDIADKKRREEEEKNKVIAEDSVRELTETALTASERNSLPDNIFGIPSSRRYPLHDKAHIVQAIRMFGNEKEVKNKKILARNITRQVVKQKLVGKLSIGKDNPDAKYFPDWMTSRNAKLVSSGKPIVIECDGETYKYTLTESTEYAGLNFYI